ALGCGVDVASELVAGLDQAYVSHDNCPHQSVICAPSDVIQSALARARERKVLAQELPFRSGFHSPLFEPYVGGMARQFGAIELVPADIPLWSATTVARYPDDPTGITELAGRHLVEPVRFRQLVERLHREGVRAFVQVGTGSLMGFVDDTLRDHDVLTVSANTAKQTGVGQLRRVAAALWASGYPVDFAPLGHQVSADMAGATADRPRSPLVGEAGRPLALGSSLVRNLTPLDLGGAAPPSVSPDSAAVPGSLLAEFQAASREAAAAAHQVLGAAQRSRRANPPIARRRVSAAENQSTPAGPAAAAPKPDTNRRETVLELSVAAQPWWGDHAFYPQPDGWPVLEDRFPLVPMTAIIEMLAAEAEALVPGSVAISVEAIRAFKWLAVEPPTSVLARAALDPKATEAAGSGATVVKASIDGHARAVVHVATEYPPAPLPAAGPVNGEIAMPVTVERLYAEGHLFHGPQYQGIRSFTRFGIDGVAGRLESQPAPGALLDNAGQLFGFWMASAVDRDRLVLPTSIDRISFYGPHPEPGTAVDCVVNCTHFGEQIVRADLELTVDGEVWCRIEGWEDRRFQSDDRLFLVLREPTGHLLAEPQPGGWVLVREGWPDSASRDVVMRRFLGQAERADYDGRNPNVQRTWLLGRIAAKDAVRDLLAEPDAPLSYPVEVQVSNDANGRPSIVVAGNPDVRVSIAHTAGLGVAMAAIGVDVGIDVELVEHRPGSFEAAGFTDAERLLMGEIASADRNREITRWWSAKEAAAKAAGTGMQGRPADFEVVEVRGADLRVGHRWIATDSIFRTASPNNDTVLANPSPTANPATNGTSSAETVAPSEEYIVAWTIVEPRDG
ncbi:MAG: 4'-phosphopantetheinyl transferase superfamily protein, partial [Aquihabitans sp.]